MGAIEHSGVLALVAALTGCVVVGKWIYNSYEEDASPGGRVAAGVVLLLVLGVIVVVALAVVGSHSNNS